MQSNAKSLTSRFLIGQPCQDVIANWPLLRSQILTQWDMVKPAQLDAAGPNRRRIAILIGYIYNVSPVMIENYLLNFERTMPIAA